jgi:hypothetical protein
VGETPEERVSGKGGTLDDVTVDRLKSRLSRKRGNAERIHFSDAT